MEPEVITACENVCRDFYWVRPFTEWLSDFAIIVGLAVALYQLGVWRREHVAKRKSETALKLLSVSYAIKRAFAAVRSAMEQIPSDVGNKTDAIIAAKWDRLVSYSSEFDELRELQVLHDALVGSRDVQEAVEELFDVRQEIFAALSTLSGWKIDQYSKSEHVALHQELERSIYSMGGKYDKLGPRVNAAIDKLRASLLPEIRLER